MAFKFPISPILTFCRLTGIFAAMLVSAAAALANVPSPADTPAIVTVSGHTSTAVSITTVKVGQEIPLTYAGTNIHNMPGFAFYVSQHYALQSDMADDYSAHLLEVAELAYPHWVDLVGAEPPDPMTRMYFVYASTSELMKKAITNDTGLGPPESFGGGITLYVNHSAYNYPSGTLKYHKRALTIHENLHMLQMIVYGNGGLEDFTYSGEQSVYDPARKQLTVMVFDKATVNNWTDDGLRQFQKEKPTFAEFLARAWNVGGAPAVMLTQFLWTDPDRYLKWQIWRDEFYLGHIDPNTVVRVTESVFGSLKDLDVAWQAWLRERHNSFHYVDWGWEQEGNTLWSYGFPQHGAFSQTDLLYAPADPATFDPYRMDYPTGPASDLVGPIRRGGESPSIGATVDFSRNPRNGSAGMGLGVIDSTYYAVVIQNESTLSVSGVDIKEPDVRLSRADIPLPAEVVAAAISNGHKFGLTLRIGRDSLAATVRAGAAGAIKTAVFEIPVNAKQRDRMLQQRMAVLAKSNSHGITPYIDDARMPSPDLTRNAAANFWRFDGMDRLESLYKTAWRLGPVAPASLLNLRASMLKAVQGDAQAQLAARADYDAQILKVLHDVQHSKSDSRARSLAVRDLTGLFVLTKFSKVANGADLVTATTTLINRLEIPVECRLEFPERESGLELAAAARMILMQYRPETVTATLKPDAASSTFRYRLKWRGEPIVFTIAEPTARP